MKITKNGGKAYLSITKAELAANPQLLKVLEAQGVNPNIVGDDEMHTPFMDEVSAVFRKHKKHMSPEIKQHLHNVKGLPPEDLTPDNASSGESYQDGSDPGKPYGGNFSVGPGGLGNGGYGGGGGGMGGMGSIASKKETK